VPDDIYRSARRGMLVLSLMGLVCLLAAAVLYLL
jgi:hypothetical protein